MVKNSPEIRLAKPDEAAGIAAVLYDSFIEFKSLYTDEGFRATTPEAGEIESRFHQGPTWVALDDETIVGTVSAVLKGEALYIRSMVVLPSARGMGVARRLLEEIQNFASANGCKSLFLSTTPFLIDAIRLYERSGFKRSDEEPHDLFGTPLFTMRKSLRK